MTVTDTVGAGKTDSVSVTQSFLTTSVSSIQVGTSGGKRGFSVSASSRLTWRVSENDSDNFISITSPLQGSAMGNGTVEIFVQSNNTGVSRTADITITDTAAGGISKTVTIRQNYLMVTPSTITLPIKSLSPSPFFDITSDVYWNVTRSTLDGIPWMAVTTLDGYGNRQLPIWHAENTNNYIRTGTFTVTDSGGSATKSVTVTQGYLNVSPSSLSVPRAGGTVQFNIKSGGVNWRTSYSGVSAVITVLPLTGSGDATMTVVVPQNTGAARNITVNVTDGNGTIRQVTVSQN